MSKKKQFAPKGTEYSRDLNKMSYLLEVYLVDPCNRSQSSMGKTIFILYMTKQFFVKTVIYVL